MLRTTLLPLARRLTLTTRFLVAAVCLSMGLTCRGDDQPADALLPVNGPIETVRAEKIILEEKPGPHDWLIKNENIVRLVTQANQHRAQMGLAPLELDTMMCLDAQQHANWMAATGAFQHSSLPYLEVIFHGVPTPEAAVQGWIASPAHHAHLLSGTRVGFGYQLRGGYPYWVGVFR